MNKRGQVTIFIIIAIILVAAVGLYFVFRDTLGQGVYSPEVEGIKLFVEECVKDTGEDAIYTIGQNGGYFSAIELSTSDGIPYYYHNGKEYMPSKERIEQELAFYLENSLQFCTNDFVDFSDLSIEEGEVSATAVAQDEEVIFNVEYPLSISKENATSILRDFESIKVPIRLGIIYNSIEEMIQEQLTREDICLSCLAKIGTRNDLTINMVNTEEAIIFVVRDENYDIPLEFKFANKYD